VVSEPLEGCAAVRVGGITTLVDSIKANISMDMKLVTSVRLCFIV
jgi:hypothetical protein